MLNVAIFDDNPLVLEAINRTIAWDELGCVVVGTADNGMDAAALLEQTRVDVIISDIVMPGMDGLALAEKILNAGIHVKIILITGFSEFKLAQRAVSLGVFDLLSKPVMNEDICRVVRKAVQALQDERERDPRLLPARTSSAGLSPLVRRAMAYLEEHYVQDLTLANVADQLQVSPSYLSRLTKSEIGQGFIEILTDIRLTMALYLLRQADTKVYEVAARVGYKEYPYFYQVFKKRYGYSPKEYRKRFL